MHDLRWIRENPEEFDRGLARRGLPPQAAEVLALDREWRALADRRRGGASDAQPAVARGRRRQEARRVGRRAARPRSRAARRPRRRPRAGPPSCGGSSTTCWPALPNLPAPDVPDGPDESANREMRRVGEPPSFDFAPLSHDAIGEKLGLMDFAARREAVGVALCRAEGGAGAAGTGAGAVHARPAHDASSAIPRSRRPIWCATRPLFGTGNLPKAAEDMFRTTDGYVADPDRRGAADQSGGRRDSRRERAAAALYGLDRRASARRRAPPGATPAA